MVDLIMVFELREPDPMEANLSSLLRYELLESGCCADMVVVVDLVETLACARPCVNFALV